jgi:hypothetical protein
MRTMIRAGIAVGLALAIAGPVSADSRIRPARLGELVIVTRCDGAEITGDVGAWASADAFYVKPPDSSARLIKASDVLTIRAASNGERLDLPDHHSSNKALVVVVATIGGLLVLAALAHGLAKS